MLAWPEITVETWSPMGASNVSRYPGFWMGLYTLCCCNFIAIFNQTSLIKGSVSITFLRCIYTFDCSVDTPLDVKALHPSRMPFVVCHHKLLSLEVFKHFSFQWKSLVVIWWHLQLFVLFSYEENWESDLVLVYMNNPIDLKLCMCLRVLQNQDMPNLTLIVY